MISDIRYDDKIDFIIKESKDKIMELSKIECEIRKIQNQINKLKSELDCLSNTKANVESQINTLNMLYENLIVG